MGFPCGSVVKDPPANAGDKRDAGLIPGSGRSPGEGNGNPPQYCCGKSHGQKSLAGYSLRVRKEPDTAIAVTKQQNNNMKVKYEVIAGVSFFFFPFIFISWRLITLQYCKKKNK